MPHIQINNLSVEYPGHAALKNITVGIPDGLITAVIGPSGCGKSTMLKTINRLIDLTDGVRVSGSVLIDGVDACARDADLLALRRKLGFLLQRPYPLPMSIFDNVAFGTRIHEMDTRELSTLHVTANTPNCDALRDPRIRVQRRLLVQRCLVLAGLWDEVKDRLDQPAARLSIGQQQRLALARALAVNPKVILADEPTSALDPISTRLVETQLRALKGDYTIVIVTHILRQARRLADYVLFMYMGELIEHGPAAQVFNAPVRPETKAYISGEIS